MIKTVTDSLQRQYDTFIDEPDDWFFFLGLAEYMQYLRTTELTIPLIEGVEEQMHQFDDEFKQIHAAVEKEAKRAFEVIQGRIAKAGIEDEIIERETNEYHGFLDGTWSSTASLGQSLYRNVRNIVERLRKLDRDDLVKEYFVPFVPDPKLTEIYTITPSRDRLDDLEKKQEQSKKTQIWGSYWHLERARWAIMDGLDYMNRQKGTLRGSLNRINASPLIREMAAMERRDPNPQLQRFIKRDYLFHARRFHTFVLNTLAKVPKYLLDDQENKDAGSVQLAYSDGTIHIRGQSLRITKRQHSLQNRLMLKLFSDLYVKWDFEDVFDDLYEESRGKDDWKKLYKLIDAVNDKVAVESDAKELIRKNRYEIWIDPDYLPPK